MPPTLPTTPPLFTRKAIFGFCDTLIGQDPLMSDYVDSSNILNLTALGEAYCAQFVNDPP